MKKLLSVLITLTLLIGAASAAYAGPSNAATAGNANYKDLKTTNWAYEAVNAMSQKGIVKGYNDGSFKPSNTVTYGEFIKMALISATNEDIGNAPSVNTETGAKQNWAKSYYDKAVELKYFGTTDIKEEQLNKSIPRSDMALIISNILGETKLDNYNELESSLKDVNSNVKNDYDIVKAYATGIITGYEDSTFKPENTLTRAESATVIYRLVDESKRVKPLEKKKEENTEPATSAVPLDKMITNYKTFLNDDGTVDLLLSRTESYTIDENGASYGMTLKENKGTKAILFPNDVEKKLGVRYLIKNNKVITLVDMGVNSHMEGVGIYNSDIKDLDITTVDYIGSLTADNNMLLIANPFKK